MQRLNYFQQSSELTKKLMKAFGFDKANLE